MTRGRFIPDLLQPVTEFDHSSQNLISVEQLAQLLAGALVEQFRMSNEELRGAMREHSGTLLLRQFAKHRPYYAATVVTQDVHAIGDQRPHGVGGDAWPRRRPNDLPLVISDLMTHEVFNALFAGLELRIRPSFVLRAHRQFDRYSGPNRC
jgi:hypothetical protein